MLAEERRDRIRRELSLRGRIEVARFAETWGYSEMTIRRDLALLVEQGIARRVRGGAVLVSAGVASATDAEDEQGALGLIIPELTPRFRPIVQGALAAAKACGFRLIVGATGGSTYEEIRHLRRMRDLSIDGLLVAGDGVTNLGGPSSGDPDPLARLRVPIVSIEPSGSGAPGLRNADQVATDHASGVLMAIDHLRSKGHTRIGLLAQEEWPLPPLIAAFAETLRTTEAASSPVLVRPQLTEGEIEEFAERCVRTGTKAALVLSEQAAVALIAVLHRRGRRVPLDFAVIVYGDDGAALSSTPLTAIAMPSWALGHQAVDAALQTLRSPTTLPRRRFLLTPQLRERESTNVRASPVRPVIDASTRPEPLLRPNTHAFDDVDLTVADLARSA